MDGESAGGPWSGGELAAERFHPGSHPTDAATFDEGVRTGTWWRSANSEMLKYEPASP